MPTIRTTNNPVMLVWAREEIGYTIEQAADAIGVSVSCLKAAESGERPLTLNQLRSAAEKYQCSFGYFYFSEPPYKKSFKQIPDFRIEPGLAGADHYRLNFEIKKARDQRLIYIDLADSLDVESNSFQTIHKTSTPNLGTHIRERLGINDAELSSLTYDKVYTYWKSKIEDDGVLVYESQYIPSESGVIGIAIYYENYPIILIKRGGRYNIRRLFTLLHEYAHLIKGKSAINDADSLTINQENTDEEKLEAVCNRLAADILIPPEKINLSDYADFEPIEKMEELAKAFKVTYSTAAVYLRRLNLISQSELSNLLELRNKANESKRNKGDVKKPIKIPREYIERIDKGQPMFNMVLNAYSTGTLDVFDASKLLNLRVHKIDKLILGSS